MHGIMDYLLGIVLIGSPWLFGFARGGPETSIPVIVGIVILLLSICTNYEYGLIKKVAMPVHLYMDIIAGILLLISPWIFGFRDYVIIPHVIFGILEIGAGFMTSEQPSFRNAAGSDAANLRTR